MGASLARMKKALGVGFGVLAVLSLEGTSLAADYGAKGTEAATTSTLPAGTGGATGGKVVVPSGAGPWPILVASHGFSASADA